MATNQHLEYKIHHDPDSAYLMINLKFWDKAFVKISALNIRDASIKIGKAVMNNSWNLQLNFSLTSNLTIHEITAPKLPGSVYLIPDVLGSIEHH